MKIYVGNLSYSSTEEDIRAAFQQFGTVDTAELVIDRSTGRSRGFAFVEMGNDDEARASIAWLNEKDLDGRSLKVNEARPRTDRPERSNDRY